MKKQDIFLPSNDGMTRLHGIVWVPDDGNIKAVLQLVHGMVEYIDRYNDFAEYLTGQGFAVIGHDHLGHGQSVTEEKKLGYFSEKNGSKILVDDMASLTKEAKKRWPGLPDFILGHSMGSFLLRDYITRYGDLINGAIVMGTGFIPAFAADFGIIAASLAVLFRGPFYRSTFLTGIAVGANNRPFKPNRTEADWLSRNEENVDRYIADPLCGYRFTAAAYKDFFIVLGRIGRKKDFEKIPKNLPVLITSGARDPVGGEAVCPKVLASLKKAGLTDVSMKLYEDDRHEILNELDRKTVYEDLKNWMLSKIR